MICEKCKEEFMEKDLQLSHDTPRYIGGIDSDGRHYLCEKCHSIYERLVFYFMTKDLPENIKEAMRFKSKIFAERWFNDS